MNDSKENKIDKLDDMGFDINFLIREAFLGYKYRKYNHQLYDMDATIPTKLITMYYETRADDASFDKMKKSFISRYVINESKVEGVNEEDIHGQAEIEGFEDMYEYIHSDDIEYMFDVYTLKDLHKKLFSHTEFPECGGDFRNTIAYLRGTRTELADYTMIRPLLNELDNDVQYLREYGKLVKDSNDVSMLLDYMDQCVVLNAKLIGVHPFYDGNGRTVRGFTNKLFEDVGLPPIYIKATEKDEYRHAMAEAINEKDYAPLQSFYRYKVCDSIIELDINDRVRSDYKEVKKEDAEKLLVKETAKELKKVKTND